MNVGQHLGLERRVAPERQPPRRREAFGSRRRPARSAARNHSERPPRRPMPAPDAAGLRVPSRTTTSTRKPFASGITRTSRLAANRLKCALPTVERADRVLAKRLEPGRAALVCRFNSPFAPGLAAAADLLLAGNREIVAHHVGNLFPCVLIVGAGTKIGFATARRRFGTPWQTELRRNRPARRNVR